MVDGRTMLSQIRRLTQKHSTKMERKNVAVQVLRQRQQFANIEKN